MLLWNVVILSAFLFVHFLQHQITQNTRLTLPLIHWVGEPPTAVHAPRHARRRQPGRAGAGLPRARRLSAAGTAAWPPTRTQGPPRATAPPAQQPAVSHVPSAVRTRHAAQKSHTHVSIWVVVLFCCACGCCAVNTTVVTVAARLRFCDTTVYLDGVS